MGIRTGNPAWVDSATEVEAQANPGRKITAAKLNAIEAAIDDSAEATHDHDARYVRTVNGTGPDGSGDVTVSGGGGGVTDHGALTGLSDDDHAQYALADGSRGAFAPPLGADDNYVTDAEKAALHGHSNKAALDNVSGVNTGDQDLSGYALTSSLGTAAAEDVGAFATAAQGVKADAAIPSGLVDAKGDLIVATADNTVTRLPASTDGHVLTLDSAQAAGMKWAAPSGGGGGSDPWTYQVVTTPTTNDSTTSVNIAGLSVPDLPDGTYHFQWILVLTANSPSDTAKATVGWSGTGVTVAAIGVISNTGESGAFVTPVHGNGHYATNSSSPTPSLTPVAVFQGVVTASGMSGEVRALLAAETNGKEVSANAGSFVAYRRIGD